MYLRASGAGGESMEIGSKLVQACGQWRAGCSQSLVSRGSRSPTIGSMTGQSPLRAPLQVGMSYSPIVFSRLSSDLVQITDTAWGCGPCSATDGARNRGIFIEGVVNVNEYCQFCCPRLLTMADSLVIHARSSYGCSQRWSQ